jgi:hypothetical protein
MIVVRPAVTGGGADDALIAEASAAHALLGLVSWDDRQRRVTIHVMNPAEGQRWVDREIVFDAADAPAERGRTVGFAVASMVPDEALPTSHPPTSPVLPSPPPPEVMARPAQRFEAPSPGTRSVHSHRLSLDASAVAVGAIDGVGGGVGGVIALRAALGSGFATRIAFGARAGEISVAQATTNVIGGAAGLAWQPFLDKGRRWAAGLRLDAQVQRQEVVHLSADDPSPAHRSRFIPAFDAAVEGAFRFVDYASLIAAVGTEVAFGRTDVYVHDRVLASVAPARLFGEAGLRVSF